MNNTVQTNSDFVLRNDGDSGDIATAPVSDVAGTTTIGKKV